MATTPATASVMTILYDTKQRKFLGRGGRWMTAQEFDQNPPASPAEIVPPTATRRDEPPRQADPGGRYECLNGSLCLITSDPSTGDEQIIDFGVPCPW